MPREIGKPIWHLDVPSIKSLQKDDNVSDQTPKDVASVLKTTAASKLEAEIQKELEVEDPKPSEARAILDDIA